MVSWIPQNGFVGRKSPETAVSLGDAGAGDLPHLADAAAVRRKLAPGAANAPRAGCSTSNPEPLGCGTHRTVVLPPRVVHHSMQTLRRSNDPRLTSETTMPIVKLRASTILGAFEEAQSELVGKAVVLMDGKAGTVENVWLDELHGLRISIIGHDGKWPISTIKFAQS
jgi:hypothetical protein